MISLTQLVRQLQRERFRWKRRELETDYVMGLREGLSLAELIARKLYRETKHQPHRNPDGLKRSHDSV